MYHDYCADLGRRARLLERWCVAYQGVQEVHRCGSNERLLAGSSGLRPQEGAGRQSAVHVSCPCTMPVCSPLGARAERRGVSSQLNPSPTHPRARSPLRRATYGETLLVAPVCSALNDFSTMVHVKKTSLKNSESFELLGGLLELEALHPDYVGPASGRPDEPEPGADFRAPYPVFHFLIMPGERPKDPMFMNGKEHMRMMLNNLYRSPAVSSSEDEVPAPPEAAAGFETVMEQTTAWLGELEESKSLPEGPSEPERWFTDLDEQLAEDMMVGSGRIAEHVLSEAWAVVDALSTSAASADAQEGEDRVLSKLLVLPNAHPNSAGIFYSIADHLRAALEASPILDVFTVETFHPEDVQDKGKLVVHPRSCRRKPLLLVRSPPALSRLSPCCRRHY
jgi:hypothetical protein